MNKFKLLIVILFLLEIYGCSKQSKDIIVLNQQKNFFCPKPGIEKFENWGETGRERICEIRNGSFAAAENGLLFVTGQYSNGSETGIWRWYDKQGNVVKEINYSSQKNE